MLRAYYQLTKPERTIANLLTATAGYLFGCRWHIVAGVFVALLVGTSLIIASAGVLNNYIDHHIDKKMRRTRARALPSGVVSRPAALRFCVLLGVIGFLLLGFFVNGLVTVLGIIAYIDYVAIYGWTKRHTKWSTIAGSVSGALPVTAGYCAASGRVDAAAVWLFLIMTFWQMPHFYMIALFRLKDYAAAGLPVWPLANGLRSTVRQTRLFIGLYCAAAVALSWNGPAGWVFLTGMLLSGGYWLGRSFRRFNAAQSELWARSLFGVSLYVLLIFSLLLCLDPLVP